MASPVMVTPPVRSLTPAQITKRINVGREISGYLVVDPTYELILEESERARDQNLVTNGTCSGYGATLKLTGTIVRSDFSGRASPTDLFEMDAGVCVMDGGQIKKSVPGAARRPHRRPHPAGELQWRYHRFAEQGGDGQGPL